MTMTTSDTVSELLAKWQEGEEVQELVMPLVYRELRAIAASLFASERIGHTLPPTGLVHEGFLRIRNGGPWDNRAHFFSAAAKAMRCVLVDYARRHKSQKRWGHLERVDLTNLNIELVEPLARACRDHPEILTVDKVIDELKDEHPRWARVIELRFFAGFSIEEVAEHLGLSSATIRSDWFQAKRWLAPRLAENSESL